MAKPTDKRARTKPRQFEISAESSMQHLRVFHDVARALTSTLQLETILTAIMEQMANFFGPETWSLLMLDEAAAQLNYVIAVGENSESLKGLHIKLGEGIAGWVAQTGTPLVIPDVENDPRFSALAHSLPDFPIRSIACIPIRSEEKILGVIQLLNSTLDLMSPYSISFLHLLCDYAAIAIRNADSMERIHTLSITDDCTGLFNARHLYLLLEEEISKAEAVPLGEPQPEFCLVFFDLDHFKTVNDSYGHLAGSRLLAEVGGLIKKCLGPEDSGFRYGGDEFVLLLPGLDKQRGIAITQRIYERLRRKYFLEAEGISLRVRGSYGMATYPEDGDSIQSIIRSADTMMYEAKLTRDNIAVAGRGLLYERIPSPPVERYPRPGLIGVAPVSALPAGAAAPRVSSVEARSRHHSPVLEDERQSPTPQD